MNYISPIEMITTQMRMTYEEEVLNTVHDVGILVDKKELEKALKYDRNQYNKGFSDGIGSVLEIIDTSQTYKMTAGETDTYIDKRVLREAVEALREGEE